LKLSRCRLSEGQSQLLVTLLSLSMLKRLPNLGPRSTKLSKLQRLTEGVAGGVEEEKLHRFASRGAWKPKRFWAGLICERRVMMEGAKLER